jgi:NAD(P)H-dependent FMN reductase
MTKIGIILGSTRPGRNGKQVADWVLRVARQRRDADYELVDLLDHPLPHLDEPLPPSQGPGRNEHTKRWARTVAGYDGFVIVTPEYNHSTSGVLKTRWTTCSRSGTTRPWASSRTAGRAAPARWSTCGRSRASS